MKAFLEEWGLIILAVIGIGALIAIAVYFSSTVKTGAKGQLTNITNIGATAGAGANATIAP